MDMKISTPILVVFLIQRVILLRIYKSNGALSEKVISGLKYRNENSNTHFTSNDFTACIRSNVKRLTRDESGKLLVIDNLNWVTFQKRHDFFLITGCFDINCTKQFADFTNEKLVYF